MARHAPAGPARVVGGSRRSRTAAALVCLGLGAVAVSVGASAVTTATAGPDALGTARTTGVSAAVVPAPAAAGLSDVAAPVAAPVVAPVVVRVPSLGISSSLVRLGVASDGTLEVPADAAVAGWFAPGVAPGAVGPAVIAGHVDSPEGPGVFARLPEVAVGSGVEVDRDDGSTASFVVTRVQQVAKDAFPTDEVYGPVAGPELRLVTCGGVFDESTQHYQDNVVVYARLD